MKTTVFKLIDPIFEMVDENSDLVKEIYIAPTLPAYAILNSEVERSCETIDLMYMPARHEVSIDRIIIDGVNSLLPTEVRSATLTVNYSGIRDYKLLFPQVTNKRLKERLGQFAEEAEIAFDAGAWMSFTIMAASVLEGLLFDVYEKYHFHELIDLANENGAITNDEADLLNNVREIRNRVHASKYKQSFSDRKVSNDLYVLYDRLIKKNWAKKDV
ncbi:MAG: hypothetical protein OEW89_02280 [Gammaproteobacteria bacterium]|nr:hypothetical protein [Gammaproteobacteria bacterium]